jgi:hypothetical protein
MHPALQLGYLQTLPMDLIEPMIEIMRRWPSVPVHEPVNGSRMNEPSLPHSKDAGILSSH